MSHKRAPPLPQPVSPQEEGTSSGTAQVQAMEIHRPMNVKTRQKRGRDELTEDMFKAHMDDLRSLITSSTQRQEDSMRLLREDMQDLTNSISNIRTELDSLQTSHSRMATSLSEIQGMQVTINTEHADFKSSLEFMSTQYEVINDKFKRSEIILESTENTELEIKNIKTEVMKLRHELQLQHQWERLLNLEISGLPEIKSENLSELIVRIAKHAEVALTSEDIVHATRVQPRQKVPGRPNSIIVKFKTRLHKENILAGLRKNRGMTTLDISIPGDSRRIFVSEHLTVDNKLLYKQVRETAKSKNYQYTWTKNCRIYIRKNDTSPAIHIGIESDLAKIK